MATDAEWWGEGEDMERRKEIDRNCGSVNSLSLTQLTSTNTHTYTDTDTHTQTCQSRYSTRVGMSYRCHARSQTDPRRICRIHSSTHIHLHSNAPTPVHVHRFQVHLTQVRRRGVPDLWKKRWTGVLKSRTQPIFKTAIKIHKRCHDGADGVCVCVCVAACGCSAQNTAYDQRLTESHACMI